MSRCLRQLHHLWPLVFSLVLLLASLPAHLRVMARPMLGSWHHAYEHAAV